MVITSFDLPAKDTAEITLIGTAGGYGESVVIHLGNHKWAVIDSCIDPFTKKCLPLEYLESIGVDLSNDVVMIICTHWHNDHIRGLSKLLSYCDKASFCFAPCTDQDKFLLFVNMDEMKIESNRSTAEFKKCLDLYNARGYQVIRAIQDRQILNIDNTDYESVIYTLSPSDATLKAYDLEISQLIESIKPTERVLASSPNAKSVVLSVGFGEHRAILGADLEISGNAYEGWVNILDNCTVLKNKRPASLLKISHHGSENGYHQRIWDELLITNAVGKLTPYNKSNLPREEMLNLYSSHTVNLFSTSKSGLEPKSKKRDRSMEKAIRDYRPSLREIKYSMGIVRSRILLTDKDAVWTTDVYGPAYQV